MRPRSQNRFFCAGHPSTSLCEMTRTDKKITYFSGHEDRRFLNRSNYKGTLVFCLIRSDYRRWLAIILITFHSVLSSFLSNRGATGVLFVARFSFVYSCCFSCSLSVFVVDFIFFVALFLRFALPHFHSVIVAALAQITVYLRRALFVPHRRWIKARKYNFQFVRLCHVAKSYFEYNQVVLRKILFGKYINCTSRNTYVLIQCINHIRHILFIQ